MECLRWTGWVAAAAVVVVVVEVGIRKKGIEHMQWETALSLRNWRIGSGSVDRVTCVVRREFGRRLRIGVCLCHRWW